MKIYKNAWFIRFARTQNISADALRKAVRRAENGQIDADLGGWLIKQRVARMGQGKSRGYRTIILYRAGEGKRKNPLMALKSNTECNSIVC